MKKSEGGTVDVNMKASLYGQLKDSVVNGSGDDADFNFHTYEPAPTEHQSEQILGKILLQNRVKKTEYFAILGVELANLKFLKIRNKCQACSQEMNMYKVLNCRSCNSKKNYTKDYYSTVRHITGFSKDYVNFLIAIGRICRNYPKFLRVTMSTDDVKNKIGLQYLEGQMAKDVDFWKQTVTLA